MVWLEALGEFDSFLPTFYLFVFQTFVLATHYIYWAARREIIIFI